MAVPIPRPGKIVCVGLNYRDHAEEQGAALPEAPLLFAKFTTALIGPGDAIVIPPTRDEVRLRGGARSRARHDGQAGLEGERPRGGRGVRRRERRVRARPSVRRRPVDARQVAGHVLPGRPARARRRTSRIRTPSRSGPLLNGEVVQDSTTANLVFGVDEVISYASQTATLEAGDLILTGTPAGVGIFRTPPRLLEPGDEITIEIDGVGSLTNPVVAG